MSPPIEAASIRTVDAVMTTATPLQRLVRDGKPIDEHARSLGVADRLRLFDGVCAAVAYAHQQDVRPRDRRLPVEARRRSSERPRHAAHARGPVRGVGTKDARAAAAGAGTA